MLLRDEIAPHSKCDVLDMLHEWNWKIFTHPPSSLNFFRRMASTCSPSEGPSLKSLVRGAKHVYAAVASFEALAKNDVAGGMISVTVIL